MSYALLSVSNKEGIVDLAKYYEEKGFSRYGSLPNGAVKLRKKP